MHNLTSFYCLKVVVQVFFFFQYAIINRISPISMFLLSLLCFVVLLAVCPWNYHSQTLEQFFPTSVLWFTSTVVKIHRAMDYGIYSRYWFIGILFHSFLMFSHQKQITPCNLCQGMNFKTIILISMCLYIISNEFDQVGYCLFHSTDVLSYGLTEDSVVYV